MIRQRLNQNATFMGLRVLRATEMDAADWRDWTDILESTPELHSPFLRPEFVRCVAETAPDVRVARWESCGAPAYFPFHQRRRTIRALGFGMAEWQAVVSRRAAAVDWLELMRRLRVPALHFDHFYAWQLAEESQAILGASPYMELASGFASYLERRKQLGNGLVRQTQRKHRKLEREHGVLELEYDAPIAEAMDCLFRWKRDQHRRTGVVDAFADSRVTQLLTSVAHCRSDTFRGRVSWLKCAGKPIAVHLGVETRRTAHMWYPAYDPQWANYSPGNVMFLSLAEAMADAGIERFDFGPGGQAYKERFSTAAESVARGVFDSHRVKGWVRLQCRRLRQCAAACKRRFVSMRPNMPVASTKS